MPNIGRILKGHNRAVLADQVNTSEDEARMCNCRNKETCPLKGKCLSNSLVYMATVTPAKGKKFNYKGLSADEFKNRYNDHNKTFRNPIYRTRTELSKAIWDLKDKNISYKIYFYINQFISLGYSIPGAVVALSVIIYLTYIDDVFSDINLLGSFTVYFMILIYAYIIRFLAVGKSPIKLWMGLNGA